MPAAQTTEQPMHDTALDFVRRALERTGPRRRVVEFGGRDVNGSARALFGDAAYVTLDLLAGPGVDLVGDAAEFQPDAPFDTVLCTSVLEHTPRAAEVVASAFRALEPGGALILTTVTDPFPPHSGIDGSMPPPPGEYYRNPTRLELVAWLEPFGELWLEHTHANGDIFALARR